MESVQHLRLGDCVTLHSGGTPSKARGDYWDGDIPWVSCKDMKVDYIRDAEDHLTLLGTQNGTRVVPENTILIVVRGMILAREFPVAMTKRAVAFNQDLKAVKPADFVENEYLFHWFRANANDIVGRADEAGHGTKRVQTDRLLSMPIAVPSLPEQRRIAGVLSAYDDLIDNSQRRIRILEEMARALYREWFVDLRFPSHEKVKVQRGATSLGDIPQGWEVLDLAKVCADGNGVQTGPFGSQLHESDYSEEGVPVVMPKDLIDFRIRTNTIARIPEATADKLSRHRMQPGDIVYGRRGDIGRRAFLMPYQAGWFCGTGCLRIRPNPRVVNGWYLFNYLGQDDVVGLIAGRAQGVTMPNLNTGVMSSVPVKLPTRKLQDDFSRLTFPMAEAREALTAKIENLRRTRDLLLPRLLSGEALSVFLGHGHAAELVS